MLVYPALQAAPATHAGWLLPPQGTQAPATGLKRSVLHTAVHTPATHWAVPLEGVPQRVHMGPQAVTSVCVLRHTTPQAVTPGSHRPSVQTGSPGAPQGGAHCPAVHSCPRGQATVT